MAGNRYDFQSTAMHELLHTLGFLSYTERPGANTGLSWTVYDSYLVTSGGTAVIGGDYRWNTAHNANLLGGGGGLYFGGPNAVGSHVAAPFRCSPQFLGFRQFHLPPERPHLHRLQPEVDERGGRPGLGVRVISPVEVAIPRISATRWLRERVRWHGPDRRRPHPAQAPAGLKRSDPCVSSPLCILPKVTARPERRPRLVSGSVGSPGAALLGRSGVVSGSSGAGRRRTPQPGATAIGADG